VTLGPVASTMAGFGPLMTSTTSSTWSLRPIPHATVDSHERIDTRPRVRVYGCCLPIALGMLLALVATVMLLADLLLGPLYQEAADLIAAVLPLSTRKVPASARRTQRAPD
jgi:hypothetical protein